MAKETVREAVGVFHDEASLQAAVDELLISGFDRSQMSLLASQRAVDDKLGHLYDKVAEIEDDADVPRIAYSGTDSRAEAKGAAIGVLGYVGAVTAVGAIVASGGTVAAALAGDDVHVHDLPDVTYSFEGGVSRDLSFMKRLGL